MHFYSGPLMQILSGVDKLLLADFNGFKDINARAVLSETYRNTVAASRAAVVPGLTWFQ